MRTTCERCETALPVGAEAYICSYECTFCRGCRDTLDGTCSNCDGELVRRPRRSEPAMLGQVREGPVP